MKVIQLRSVRRAFGGPPHGLRLRSRFRARNEVLVRMIASPINPSDILTDRGALRGPSHRCRSVPGYEGVGVVEKAGPGLLGKFLVGTTGRRIESEREGTGASSGHHPIHPSGSGFLGRYPRCAGRVVLRQPGDGPGDGPARLARFRKEDGCVQSAAGSTLGRMMIKLGKHDGFKTLNIVRRHEAMDGD